MISTTLSNLETRLEALYKKAPSLPAEVKEACVSYAPALMLIGGILTLLTSGLLKLFYYPVPPAYLGSGFASYNYYLEIAFNIIAALIMIISYQHLKKRTLKGWRLLFYLTILNLLFALSSLNFINVIGTIVFFYFLFQLKPFYHSG